MPYELGWQIKQRVIYRRYYGDITLDEIIQSSTEARELVNAGIPLVHSIIDARDMQSHPNLREIQRYASFTATDAEGWQMVIGVSGVARMLVSVLTQLTGKRFRVVDNVEDAMVFLHSQDQTLLASDTVTS